MTKYIKKCEIKAGRNKSNLIPVRLQNIGLCKAFQAHITREWSYVSMRLFVSYHMRNMRERLAAHTTHIRLFLAVRPFMDRQIVSLVKLFAALVAREASYLLVVSLYVNLSIKKIYQRDPFSLLLEYLQLRDRLVSFITARLVARNHLDWRV